MSQPETNCLVFEHSSPYRKGLIFRPSVDLVSPLTYGARVVEVSYPLKHRTIAELGEKILDFKGDKVGIDKYVYGSDIMGAEATE